MRAALAKRKTQHRECQAAALDALIAGFDEDIVDTKIASDEADAALKLVKDQLRRKELALGIGELAELKKMTKSKYFELRMNARALKSRLRDRLRARKFERDGVERSSRRQQASGKCSVLTDIRDSELTDMSQSLNCGRILTRLSSAGSRRSLA